VVADVSFADMTVPLPDGSPPLPNPHVVWAKRLGGTGEEMGRGLAFDGTSALYITGSSGAPLTSAAAR